MSLTADVVVIGAGVIGSSVAHELRRQGKSVIVVDKSAGVGQGSTSSSSGVMRFNYSTLDGVGAAWESLHCWLDWRGHLDLADDGEARAAFVRTGVAMLDVPIAPRHRAVDLFDVVGVPYEEWDADELERRIEGIDAGRYWPPKRIASPEFWEDATERLGALYTPDGGFIDDPMLAATNLAQAAIRKGARFLFKSQVQDVLTGGGRVRGVRLHDNSSIEAPVVVNCGGPWSTGINAMAGAGRDFTISVRPMRQEVQHVAAPTAYSREGHLGPVVADLDLGTYIRPAPGGMMMVGGTEPECEPFEWIDDPDRSNPHRTVAVFESQVTRAARRFPQLRVPSQPKGIAGVYDVASDWTPIYDRTDLDGFYVAMGTSGNQFKNAPVAGQMMAALIDGVESGRDHDADPIELVGTHTGRAINIGAYSRKRTINSSSSGTVMG